MMKVGDFVRFLNEVGGGRVAGFPSKNIVLVEDEDGFQVPVALNEVVVVEDDRDDRQHGVVKEQPKAEKKMEKNTAAVAYKKDDSGHHVADDERNGGDVLSAYVAFVPIDSLQLSTTRFEAYFINDCNYEMYFTVMTAEGNGWRLRAAGIAEPNTKVFIEELGREELNEWDRVGVQLTAYKRKKPFLFKPTVDVQLRIDTVKFYKLHTFVVNDFFEQNALVYTVVENDKVARPLVIDAKRLKQEMAQKKSLDTMPARKDFGERRSAKDSPVVVDLHASELLETTAGLSAADILNYQMETFRKTLAEYAKKKGTRIVFIHGKGEGVLRHAIVNELRYRYKQYTYQDASFQEYGYGATEVRI